MSEIKYRFWASDLESTGLLEDLRIQGATARLHNFCAIEIKDKDFEDIQLFHPNKRKSREELQEFISAPENIFIMHNGLTYDMLALQFFGLDTSKMKIVDTLPMSFYLANSRERHGLEYWGEEFGVPKPKIDDWESLTQEDYDHRVIEDCKIQRLLWMKFCREFGEMYGCRTQTDVYKHRVCRYIQAKQIQLQEQEVNKWKFNVAEAQKLFDELDSEVINRTETLRSVMPKVPKYADRKKPVKPYKANGELSVAGEKWKEVTEENGYPFSYTGVIKVITKYEEPNPASSAQVKSWLESLGWIPETFEYKREEDGSVRAIPQVNKKNSGGLVCKSVEKLKEQAPEVEALEGLGIVKHRFAMVKGWLNSHEDGELVAGASGFTNTLRLKHRTLVNMPSGRVPYGLAIRGLLQAREGCILTGSDLASLENRWKFHHQYPLDPDFVLSQMSDDFDPHMALAVAGGLMTVDDMNFYKIFESKHAYKTEWVTKELDKRYNRALEDEDYMHSEIKRIAKIRAVGKQANYACLPLDTKVLTPQGFKNQNELSVGDVVYSYKDGTLVEDVIKYKHYISKAEVAKFGDSKKSIRSTRNHRWLTSGRGKDVVFKELQEFSTETKILATAPYVGGKGGVSIQVAEFIGWLLSDGSTSGGKFSIAQSKNKFYLDVEACLKAVGLNYNKYTSTRENGNDVYIYQLKSGEVRNLLASVGVDEANKHEFNWSSWVLELSRNSLRAFVEAFWKADGYNTLEESFVIRQNEGNIQEGVMLAMYLLGEGRVKVEGSGKCKVLRKHKTPYIGTQRKRVLETTVEDVFCLTTENGSFVIKQDEEILLTGNCQYGSGAETLARTAKIDMKMARKLKSGYDKLNWSIPVIAQAQKVKSFKHGKYLLNPVNNIYYPLKAEKDRFSTLIQGSGSYTLDLWIQKFNKIRKQAIKSGRISFAKLLGTFHDELIVESKIEDGEEIKAMLLEAIDEVNKSLKLFVPIACDIKQGKDYSEIH